ncbi:hypothetical protein GCM10023340_21000 [Nocardioides marinquilinus]|uniref:Peptidase M15C domain-containing protein n=1 Tax=Nocardioides marinquilinus TaxID=1210400 RepID=A0ABP9PLY8_9ACTN
MRPRLVAAVLLAALATTTAGCGSDAEAPPRPDSSSSAAGTTSSAPATTPEPTEQPSTREPHTPTEPTEPAERFSTYPLGTRPLPLRPDGYGEVRPTPPTLRERRYPTRDVLPPPPDGAWRSTVAPVTPDVAARLTWSPGCPVALADLRYLTLSFRGFDGEAHTGELVVAASEADDVLSVFEALFAADFPIEEMRLPEPAELTAPPTGDGNNTAAYVCRPTTGQTSGFSAHAYGLALDLNPFMNPYLKDGLVLPELASSYLDRDDDRPGMVQPDSLAVREFARIGWSWGGDFQTLLDYQHFTATGR